MSFHNYQLKLRFKYTFLVFSFWSSFFLWWIFSIITSFGALIFPINASTNDMAQQRKYTSKFRPHYETEGEVSHKTNGMYHTWWKVVINLSLVVYGQMMYLATPMINFFLNKNPTKSTYHNSWSTLTNTIEARSKWESWMIMAKAPTNKAWLHAHKNS